MEGDVLQNLLFYRSRISKDREAIYDYDTGKRYTYGELHARSIRMANFLSEDCGLTKGDCVGFFSANHPAFFEVFFASFYTGIIVTTYNYRLKGEELLSQIRNERPKVLFYEQRLRRNVENFMGTTAVERFVCLDGGSSGASEYEQALAGAGETAADTPISEEDIQMYFHTGGTTGTPKTAMISYRTVFYNCICDIMTNALSMEDAEYVFLPLFHTSGWNIITLPLLMCGGRIILTRGFSAGQALRIIAEERPTVGMAVPSVYKSIMEHPDFLQTDLSCFRWLASGGSTVQKAVMESYWKRGIPLTNGYGMTEIGPHNMAVPMVNTTVEWLREKWNSIGVPMYFNQVRIVDDQEHDVPDGSLGELLFKGPLVFSGYLNAPRETAAITRDGWVHTGDIAWRDTDGYYYIAGRKKMMFISGGENIFPIEIESIISSYPGVRDVCVIGVKDEQWGEVGKAILVVDRALYDEKQLIDYLKDHLSTIKIPKYFEVTEDIPLNSAGKRDMRRIHQLFGDPHPT